MFKGCKCPMPLNFGKTRTSMLYSLQFSTCIFSFSIGKERKMEEDKGNCLGFSYFFPTEREDTAFFTVVRSHMALVWEDVFARFLFFLMQGLSEGFLWRFHGLLTVFMYKVPTKRTAVTTWMVAQGRCHCSCAEWSVQLAFSCLSASYFIHSLKYFLLFHYNATKEIEVKLRDVWYYAVL